MNQPSRGLRPHPALLLTLVFALAGALPAHAVPTLLVNEVATSETGADWAELVCVDDGNGGAGASLAGWTLSNLSSAQKTFGATTVRTGDLVLVQYASDLADEAQATGGLIHAYTASSGMTATSDQLALVRPDASVADALCWGNSTISATQLAQVQTLVNAGQWVDQDPAGAGFEDCCDSAAMGSGKAYARYAGAPDTNSRNDFALVAAPTKGAANAPAPALAGFRISGLPVYAVAGEAVTATVTALDAAGQALASYGGHPALTVSTGSVAPATVTKNFLSGAAAVSLAFSATGPLRLTVTDGAVAATSDPFYVVATRPAPTFLVNEVAFNGGGGGIAPADWVELYCAYDGTDGNGFDLAGYALKDDDVFLTFARGVTLRTGDYLVVRFGADASTGAGTLENGIFVVPTTKSGLTATDEQIELLDPDGRIVDAVLWARHTRPATETLPASEKADIAEAIAAGEWRDLPPAGADATDCIDSNRVETRFSLGRDRYATDSNRPDDFILSAAPTPGRRNIEAGVGAQLAFLAGSPLVMYTKREARVVVAVADVFGNPVPAADEVIVSSDQPALELSVDGGNTYRTSVAGKLVNGTLEVILRGTAPAAVTLSAADSSGTLSGTALAVDLRRYPYLVINEVMYNPSDAKESDAEFIEIANAGEGALALAGYTLAAGSKTFAFPAGATLAVGAHAVVCSSLAGFEKLHGDGSGVFGDAPAENYPLYALAGLALANSAGAVTLRSPDGLYSTTFSYLSAMGGNNDGTSLEKVDPDVVDTGDPVLDAFNWTSSTRPGGSPGSVNGAAANIRPPLEIVHTFVQQLRAESTSTQVELAFEPADPLDSVNVYWRRKGDPDFQSALATFEAPNWVYRIVGEDYVDVLGSTLEYYFYGVGADLTAREPATGVHTKAIPNYLQVPADVALELQALVNGANAVTLHYREKGTTAYAAYAMTNVLGTAVWQYRVTPFELSRNGIEYYLTATDGTRTTRFPVARPNIGLAVVDVVPKVRLAVTQDRAAKDGSFGVAVRIENATDLKTVRVLVGFPKDLFTALDADAARPDDQGERGALLAAGFTARNDLDVKNGTYEIDVRSDVAEKPAAGSTAVDGLLATFRLKPKTDAVGTFAFDVRSASVNGSDRVDAYGASIVLAASRTEATLGPEGGTFTGPGGVAVTIPAGALSARVAFAIERVDGGLPALLDPALGDAFDYGFFVTPEVPGLLKPATVQIPYASTEVQGRDEGLLRVTRYDAAPSTVTRAPGRAPSFGVGFYQPVSIVTRDKTGNTVSLVSQKLGLFRLSYGAAPAGRAAIDGLRASPDPFSPNGNGRNDSTFLYFTLARDADVTVRLFDVRGRELRRLSDGVALGAGEAKIEWDGRDDFGSTVPTGIYLIKVAATDADGHVAKRNATVTVSARLRE